ncbi:MAG: magnesium transporter [Mycoplasma sp.]|nr:magnesium transporter [Mycoplasma sp.]
MTLKTAVRNKKVSEIRKIVKETPIADLAEMLEKIPTTQLGFFFRVLGVREAGKLFAFLDHEKQELIIKLLSDKEQKTILENIYADDIVDIIEEMPSNISKQILKNTPKDKRSDINKLLRYKDNQTGSIMSIDMVEIKQTLSCYNAIKLIRQEYQNIEDTSNYYVVNSKGQLVGAVKLQSLVFADENKKVKDVMTPVGSVLTTMDKESATLEFAKHDSSTLPVINSQGYLTGMITSDDIIDTIQEEATEDIHKMAGIENIDNSYLKISIIKLFRSRVLWILLLMISATLSQIVLDGFINIADKTLGQTAKGVAITGTITSSLIAIVPVISGSAGNAGAQSSTMITRSIALGEIKGKDIFNVLKKEIFTGAMIGITLSIVNFIRLIIYYAVQGSRFNQQVNILVSSNTKDIVLLWIAFASSISLFVIIIFAKTIGGALPLIAKKLKLDPAVMAAPLLTTLIDALSILIFFGISIGIIIMVI